MNVIFDTKLVRDLKKLKRKDSRLVDLVLKKLELFKLRQDLPSLRLHKLTGSMRNLWSISINESIRMIFYYVDENIATFIDIGKHEEVYKN